MWNQDGFTEADYNADELNRFPSVAASRGSGNAGINKEKTVRQWFVDRSVLYLPEPSGASLTAREGCPKGERGGANQNFFYNTSAPGIVLFLHAAKPKARKGKVFLVNASQIFEKENPKNSIPHAGIQRIADHAELKKNDYNLSPSRYIHTSDAEEYRPIAEIVAELDAIEAEAKETERASGKSSSSLEYGGGHKERGHSCPQCDF
jgi:type I restriction enzyme M protein